MGLTKYSFQKFTIYNIFASAIWAIVIGYASFMMGEVLLTYAEEYKYYGVGVILLLVFGISYYVKKI
jgi:membrane protein DedA with SNARE-associated domain